MQLITQPVQLTTVLRTPLGSLVLVVVVDLVVPEEGLVAIAPGEVLGADVLVGILDTLLKRGQVAPVGPVLIPEVVGVEASEEDASRDATILLAVIFMV